jgi:prephenate dehydratase
MQNLKENGIGLTSMWGYDESNGNSELYVMPKSPAKLRSAWKTGPILAEESTVFFIKGTDATGVLVKHLNTLAAAGISMSAMHATAVGGKYGCVICVDKADVEKAAKVLGAK